MIAVGRFDCRYYQCRWALQFIWRENRRLRPGGAARPHFAQPLQIAAEQPIETDVILFSKIKKLISHIALDLGQILLGYLSLMRQPLEPPPYVFGFA